MKFEDVKKKLDAMGYYIDEETLKVILSAINTKPRFLILSGPPGTGKTSLAVLLGYIVNGGEVGEKSKEKESLKKERLYVKYECSFEGRFKTFSPDGKYIVTEGYSLTIWEVGSGKALATLDGNLRAFSPDGKYVVTFNKGYTLLWEYGSWKELATLDGYFETFSPDGRYVVTDRGNDLWDIWKIEDLEDDGNYVEDTTNVKPIKNDNLPFEKLLSEILKTCPYIKLVRVRPEWTNPRDILGYRDYKGEFRKGIIYDFLLEANKNKDKLYFLILDEMNLSHPEHYMADIISAMETGGKIEIDGEEIEYPENLVIIGTINRDETTQNLSPRLLSRAINVELRTNWDLIKEDKDLADIFREIDENLKMANLGLGYREFKRFLEFRRNYEGDEWKALDYYLSSKIIPRIRGLKEDLGNILDNLIELAGRYNLVKTQEGLERKKKILERRGFVE